MRDELWFIEFGRGAALPLTPEEAPGGDGEPIVPCAQGRIIIETARPAPPNFATCSSYRRRPILLGANSVASFGYPEFNNKQNRGGPRSPAARPEDLGVTPWFSETEGPLETPPLDAHHHSSHPLNWFQAHGDLRADFSSTRNSSVEGEGPPPRGPGAQRKAYMDLRDAIALLDETCPNPEASEPSPRTPRTPVIPQAKSKRARSKSSDNSSNWSNERLSEKSGDTGGVIRNPAEREKKRPFLRKIGISKTEDRPFLSKLAPRITGKPYLEKIGPSKAVEKPFLDKIGTSKTIDKFTFNVGVTQGKSFNTNTEDEEIDFVSAPKPRLVPREARISFRKRSGKGHQLQKMYSFETEDLTSFKGSLSPVKSPRDPLRGASLDDVLDSGPSSLPPLEIVDDEPEEKLPTTTTKSSSVAELVKCRIMSSDEIISSNSCLCSPKEEISWGNSPKRKNGSFLNFVKNSPLKRQISSSDSNEPKSKESAVIYKTGDMSPTKLRRTVINQSGSSTLPKFQKKDDDDEGIYSPRRQGSEDFLDRMIKDKENFLVGGRNRKGTVVNEGIKNDESECVFDYGRRGISSDNLKLSRELFIKSLPSEGNNDSIVSEKLNLKDRQEISKEAFKQLHRKFEPNSKPSSSEETNDSNGRKANSSRNYDDDDNDDDDREKDLETTTIPSLKNKRETEKEMKPTTTTRSGVTVRSVLRKQKSVESHEDGIDGGGRSLRKPKRRIFHEPSQETMDLLTELRKVKSLLKTPSIDDKLDDFGTVKLPKKILLTDIEFCLSIDRENSVRRKPKKEEEEEEGKEKEREDEKKREEIIDIPSMPGPALIFEKRGLSLDYADDDKPSNCKPETRAISLVSARSPPSDTEETNSLIYDSKSYGSDVFNSPSSEEMVEGSSFVGGGNKNFQTRKLEDVKRKDDPVYDDSGNHCNDVDIAIPIDQKNSPRRRVQIQARTSDLYEIISPRSTPFRVKKGLGKISVEDNMKQESFTLGKVDCRSVVVQKRNRCFPL